MAGRYVLAGVLAGLAGGVAFGLMMQFITTLAPNDGRVPMMQIVANVVRSENLAVGWIYHLFNSAVLGAIFGLLAGNRRTCSGNQHDPRIVKFNFSIA